MFRVIIATIGGLALAQLISACSVMPPLQASYRGGGDPVVGTPGGGAYEGKATAKGSDRGDRAPKGSWEKAPKGALADRRYDKTRLDPAEALRLINAYRRKNGLGALKLHPKLMRAAKAHSRDLAKWDRISHYGSDGSNPYERIKKAGYAAALAAENVGTGQADLKEVMIGWKRSPSHNKNLLLKDAVHMGIALVTKPKSEFKTFWTLVLGKPRILKKLGS